VARVVAIMMHLDAHIGTIWRRRAWSAKGRPGGGILGEEIAEGIYETVCGE
jgi:hypothetical protein